MIETIILSAAAGFIPGALVGGYWAARSMENEFKMLLTALMEFEEAEEDEDNGREA
jgi:hypothetical protein